MKFVFVSTSLIHLVKAGLAWMIRDLEGEKYLVPSVYAEVVKTGKEKGFDDAFVTEDLIDKGEITVRKPSRELVKLITAHEDIHPGEAEVISLAKELKAIVVADDPVARTVADMHEVKREGSYAVILRTLQDGRIGREEARGALRKLVASGWRCEVELYEKVLEAIENF